MGHCVTGVEVTHFKRTGLTVELADVTGFRLKVFLI